MKSLSPFSASRFPRRLLASAIVCALVVLTLCLGLSMHARQSSGPRALVRHGFTTNGRIEGTVQQLTGESTTLNGGVITGDLLVPGTPTVVRNGQTTFGGVVQGSGSPQPSNYQVILNGGAQLGRLFTRTDAVGMPTVGAPPASTGTRDVVINSAGQSAGNFATLRDLTLNGNVGMFAIPPGTYRRFTANSNSGFTLGVAGASQPAVYNLNALTLNGGARIDIVGPVVLTTATGVTLNAAMGSSANPLWLSLKVASGGVTLNGGSALYASVTAPSGTVIINGNTSLVGGLACDRLIINSGGLLRLAQSDTTPPTLNVQQPADGALLNTASANVTGTFGDESQTTVTVNGVTATLTGNSFGAAVPLVEGANTLTVTATDAAGNRTTVTRTVTRDTGAPALSVTQPTDNAFTNQTELSVEGTVADATATSVTVNGVAAAVSGGNFSATVPVPNEGPNLLTVRAVDAAGNQTTAERHVTRDTVAPVLTLTSPTEGQIIKRLRVTGTATDSLPVSVELNTEPLDVGAGGTFDRESGISEGVQRITVAAIDAAGNVTEVKRTLTVDVTPPEIGDLTPAEDSLVDSPATVGGRVTDATAVTVKVNNSPASLSGDLFTAANVAVAEGANQVQITAVDAAGNESAAALALVGRDHSPPSAPVLFQTISPTRLAFQTISGRAEPGSVLTIGGGVEPVTANAAFGSGLFEANVLLAEGENTLTVTARDSEGNTSPAAQVTVTSDPTLAPPPAGQPSQINISTGNTQKGLVNTELPRPFIAIVTDRAGAPTPGVSVRFRVQEGGGQFVGGADLLDVVTDEHGYARARYVCGAATRLQQVRADFAGNTVTPAVFLAEALEPDPGGETLVGGSVLDQNLRALPNVLVRLAGQQTRTASDGRFLLRNVPSGPHQLLELIGRDQITLPGRWPNISYDMDVLPGVLNEPGRPFFLPKVNEGVPLPLDEQGVVTQDTSVTIAPVGGEPPVRITARAGTHVVFPPDATDKRLSVTRIATNRVPMTLEDGRATRLYISVQPSGAVFDPPLEVSFPNLDRLPANSEVLLMSFDHDAGRYVKVGTGHVSADGRVVNSDPGNGIHVGAWHATPPDPPKPEVTVIGFVQITGNPAFDNKTVTKLDAWVEGTRAVLTPDVSAIEGASRVEAKATLPMDENAVVTAAVEAQAAASKLTVEPKDVFVAIDGEKEVTATIDPALGPGTFTWKSDDKDKATVTPLTGTTHPNKVTIKGLKDGTTKVKVEFVETANPKVKLKGEVKVTIGTVKYEETQTCQGFDNTLKDTANNNKPIYWLVVGAGKTNNIVRANVQPDKEATKVTFTSAAPATATVSPATAAGDKQVLTVAGVAAGTTHVQSKFDGSDAERLNVSVKKRVVLRVTVNFVSDNAGHHTGRNHAAAQTLIDGMNAIYGPQTNVEFVLNQFRDITVPQDLGGSIDILPCPTAGAPNCSVRSPEYQAIKALADPTADRNVYFVWKQEYKPAQRNDVDGIAENPGTNLFIEDSLGGVFGQIGAHESGHNFGLDHYTKTEELRFMMYWTTDGGCFISKTDADTVNP